MLSKAFTFVIALTASGALPQSTVREPVSFDSAEAAARAEAGRTEIAAEVAGSPGQDWAGAYYWGDGLGANVSLDLAPGAGFVFEWHGCLGLYGRNYGTVGESGSRVTLEPELPNRTDSIGIDVEFLPVTWGARHYLIASGKVQDFCNAVNGGSEPRDEMHGRFLLREGDETKPVAGQPRALDGALDCVLARPLEATITSVGRRQKSAGDEHAAAIPVVVDAGREQGVWEGMEFHPLPPEAAYETARVTRVFERSSEAQFHPVAHDSFQPRPGWRLSTRRDVAQR